MSVCFAPETLTRAQVLADLTAAFAEVVTDEQKLLQLLVERVSTLTGDACVVRLLDENGVLRSAAQHHSDAKLLQRMRVVSLATQPDPNLGIWHTLLAERRLVRLAIGPDRLPSGLTREQVALFSSTPVTHLLAVPLVARGRVIGGVMVVRCTRAEAHPEEEVALLRDLGDRAALAIDNARLYAAERAARTRAEDAEDALRAELAQRLRAQELRRESDERLHLLVQSVVDYAIFLLDREGRIASWNAGAQRIYGWAEPEVINRHVGALLTKRGAPSMASVLDLAKAQGRAEVEGWEARCDDTQFWANTVVSAIRSSEGKLLGFTVITRDLTASREAQAMQELNELLEARTRELAAANEELEAFSYSVSHDLRAPLRAIDGFSQALLVDYADVLDETGTGHLHRVRVGVSRMRQLIDDMLQLSRSTRVSLEPGPVDLARIAADVEHDLRARDPSRDVQLKIPERMRVRGDPRLLRIVMENLLGNAWKFTRNRASAQVTVSCAAGPDEVVVTVADNGAGFDMAYARRLFQPFQRLHSAEEFEGTGIGLAIVRRIVHRHGGRVWAEGETDVGASFHFSLPVRESDEQPTTDGAASDPSTKPSTPMS
ncbi:MAG: ATP-binding protein [Pseudomonadota bacterium]|nr:ATP-binding protein [Pseudomonadota bacterium]